MLTQQPHVVSLSLNNITNNTTIKRTLFTRYFYFNYKNNEKILELKWTGTIEMPINDVSSFAKTENAQLFSETINIGGFTWWIKALRRYLLLYFR